MFNEYQKQASQTFKEHKALDAYQSRLLNWAVGLAGEAGEVEEVIKHHIWGEESLDKMELAKELGDVLWYLSAICTTVDLELSTVAELNANKLAHRHGTDGYDAAASANRHEREKKFEETFIYQNLKAKVNHTKAPLNVIFVGPDGAGKTTISQLVADKMAEDGFIYHKCDYRQEDKPVLALRLLAENSNVIYDRFYYPDDIIYTRVQHEKTSDEPMDWDTPYWKSYNDVLTTLDNLNTVYFLVGADEETLIARASAWADDYVSVDDLNKICTLYDRWSQFISTRPQIFIKIDTTDKSIDECVDYCVEIIHRAQAVFANLAEDTYLEKKEDNSDGNTEEVL